MGWCHEFGCQITSGCNHPMKAGAAACTCSVCDTVCEGKFSGCPEVFARAVVVSAPVAASQPAPMPPRPAAPAPQPAAAQPPAAQPPATQAPQQQQVPQQRQAPQQQQGAAMLSRE